jgi:hypothetical protein
LQNCRDKQNASDNKKNGACPGKFKRDRNITEFREKSLDKEKHPVKKEKELCRVKE